MYCEVHILQVYRDVLDLPPPQPLPGLQVQSHPLSHHCSYSLLPGTDGKGHQQTIISRNICLCFLHFVHMREIFLSISILMRDVIAVGEASIMSSSMVIGIIMSD